MCVCVCVSVFMCMCAWAFTVCMHMLTGLWVYIILGRPRTKMPADCMSIVLSTGLKTCRVNP